MLKATKQGNHDKKSKNFNRHEKFDLHNNSLISQCYLEGALLALLEAFFILPKGRLVESKYLH